MCQKIFVLIFVVLTDKVLHNLVVQKFFVKQAMLIINKLNSKQLVLHSCNLLCRGIWPFRGKNLQVSGLILKLICNPVFLVENTILSLRWGCCGPAR